MVFCDVAFKCTSWRHIPCSDAVSFQPYMHKLSSSRQGTAVESYFITRVHLNFILRQNYVQVPNFEETILIFFFPFGFLLSMKINWSLGIPFCAF